MYGSFVPHNWVAPSRDTHIDFLVDYVEGGNWKKSGTKTKLQLSQVTGSLLRLEQLTHHYSLLYNDE
jgi:hypothetical protein